MVPFDANSNTEVTRLFLDWRGGDSAALETLTPLLYQELHRIAGRYMQRERAEHTLQATALVNEAYLQIFGDGTSQTPAGKKFELRDRLHFYALAARMMRRILVDHARRRATQKRGGDRERLTLDEAKLPGRETPPNLVALDDAMAELQRLDDTKCRIVELRYFGGLTIEEVALVLDLPVDKVWEETELAKAWLHREMKEP